MGIGMFTKALVGNRELVFAYAPPQTDLDLRLGRDGKEREQKDLPKPPGKDTDKFLRSVYYYWWAFLRLNQSYMECCESGGTGTHAELYRDFGDLRDEAYPTIEKSEDKFQAWWIKRGAYLFCEPHEFPSPQLINYPAQGINDGENLMLSVPYSNDLERTLDQIRQLLKPKFDEHYRSEGHFSKALYRVDDKHNLSALQFSLRLVIAERKYLEIIGERAQLSELAIIAANPNGYKYEKREATPDPHAQLRNAAKAGLDRAHIWIENIVAGRFPDGGNHQELRPSSGIPTAERRRLHRLNLDRMTEGRRIDDF